MRAGPLSYGAVPVLTIGKAGERGWGNKYAENSRAGGSTQCHSWGNYFPLGGKLLKGRSKAATYVGLHS